VPDSAAGGWLTPKNGPYSVTWSEGALEGLVGLVPPLKILGKSRPMWHRFEQAHGSIVEVSL
jgi:hypothetical protein